MATSSGTHVLYLVGVDGGGTGTRVHALKRDGSRIGTGDSGPSALAQGIEQAWRHIHEAIARAFEAGGLPPPAPAECALGMGLSGVHAPARRNALIAHMPAGWGALAIDTDAYTTLLGAHAGRPGSAVAVGTGSVGEAMKADGTRISVGGWGFPVGDEGSGAWLGLNAMQCAQHALDGRAPAGALARAVWAVAGHTLADVQDWCSRAGQNAYAKLAPLVFDTEADDPVAARLLARGVDEIEALARALDPARELPLAMCGSLGRRFEPRLAAEWRERSVPPAGDSAAGAVHLARLALGGA